MLGSMRSRAVSASGGRGRVRSGAPTWKRTLPAAERCSSAPRRSDQQGEGSTRYIGADTLAAVQRYLEASGTFCRAPGAPRSAERRWESDPLTAGNLPLLG